MRSKNRCWRSFQFNDAPASLTDHLYCKVTGDERVSKALWGKGFIVKVPSPISSREKIRAQWG